MLTRSGKRSLVPVPNEVTSNSSAFNDSFIFNSTPTINQSRSIHVRGRPLKSGPLSVQNVGSEYSPLVSSQFRSTRRLSTNFPRESTPNFLDDSVELNGSFLREVQNLEDQQEKSKAKIEIKGPIQSINLVIENVEIDDFDSFVDFPPTPIIPNNSKVISLSSTPSKQNVSSSPKATPNSTPGKGRRGTKRKGKPKREKVTKKGPKETKTKSKFKVPFTSLKKAKALSDSDASELVVKDLSLMSEEDQLKLENWGLPISILRKYKEKGITSMFKWQLDCLSNEKVLDGKNLMYSAPTSGGKTLVAEILMIKRVLELGKKAMMILPFVSVAREKMYSLQEIFGGAGVRVEGFMGSYNPPGGFKAVDIAVCTIEKANSLINRLIEEGGLAQLGTVVVDELHLLGDSSRGYLLELLLTKLKFMSNKPDMSLSQKSNCSGDTANAKYVKLQIIGMSATLPNLKHLAKWLEAELVITDFRPVPLIEKIKLDDKLFDKELKEFRPVQLNSMKATLKDDPDHILYLSLETLLNGHSILIFSPTKAMCEKMSCKIAETFYSLGTSNSLDVVGREIKEKIRAQLNGTKLAEVIGQLQRCPAGADNSLVQAVGFGVAFHHAGLTYDERDIIESAFRNGDLRVIVATSTLSAGVNLPARRVIILSPDFNGKPLDVLVYKQMSGRAGRKGVDTEGESVIICTSGNSDRGIRLIQSKLPPIRSVLLGSNGELSSPFKRALLEVIASGAAATKEEVEEYFSSTLFSRNESDESLIETNGGLNGSNCSQEDSPLSKTNPIQACLFYLVNNDFIRVQKFDSERVDKYVPTKLGSACLASSLSPEDGISVYKELRKARECFVLDNDLHVVYHVTPIYIADQWKYLNWNNFLKIWERLSKNEKKVGKTVGVTERFIIDAMMGGVARNAIQLNDLMIHKRFFTALILSDLVNEKSMKDICDTYEVNKGFVQNLQQSASTFAGQVTAFCGKLGWSNLELLLGQFQDRLQFGVQRELCDLVKLSLLNGTRARVLYDGGIKDLADLAAAEPEDVAQIFHKSGPFSSSAHGGHANVWVIGKQKGLTELEAAQLLVEEARQYLQRDLVLAGNVEFGRQNINKSSNSNEVSSGRVLKHLDKIVEDEESDKSTSYNSKAEDSSFNSTNDFELSGSLSIEPKRTKIVERQSIKLSPFVKSVQEKDSKETPIMKVSQNNEVNSWDLNDNLKQSNDKSTNSVNNLIENLNMNLHEKSKENLQNENLNENSKGHLNEVFDNKSKENSIIDLSFDDPFAESFSIPPENFTIQANEPKNYFTTNNDFEGSEIIQMMEKSSIVDTLPHHSPNFAVSTNFKHSTPLESNEPQKTSGEKGNALNNSRGKNSTRSNTSFEMEIEDVSSFLENSLVLENKKDKVNDDGGKKENKEIKNKLTESDMAAVVEIAAGDEDLFSQDLFDPFTQELDEREMEIIRNCDPSVNDHKGLKFIATQIPEVAMTKDISPVESHDTEKVNGDDFNMQNDPKLSQKSKSVSQKPFQKSKDLQDQKQEAHEMQKRQQSHNLGKAVEVDESEEELFNSTQDAIQDTSSDFLNNSSFEEAHSAITGLISGKRITVNKITTEFPSSLNKSQMIGVGLTLAKKRRRTSLARGGIGSKIISRAAEIIPDKKEENPIHSIAFYDGKEEIFIYEWKSSHDLSILINKKDVNSSARIPQLFGNLNSSAIVMFNAKEQLRNLWKFLRVNLGKKFLEKVPNRILDPAIANWLVSSEEKEMGRGDLEKKYLKREDLAILNLGWKKSINEAFLNYKLMEALKKKLYQKDLWNHFKQTEMPSIRPLLLMELNGFGFDSMEAEKLEKILQLKSTLLELKAFQIVGRLFNLGSPNEIRQILFQELGLKKPKEKGTSKEVLMKLDHELPKIIMEWRKINSALNKTLLPFAQEKNSESWRIHGIYSHLTLTGRSVMSEPSLQCVPRDFPLHLQFTPEDIKDLKKTTVVKFGYKLNALLGKLEEFKKESFENQKVVSIRSLFLPVNPNFVIFSADYSQLELRILAHLSQDENLARAFDPKLDVFKDIAATWKNVPVWEVSDEMRKEAKALTYGIIYGMGNKALGEILEIGEIEAAQYISQFMKSYPSIRGFINDTIKSCRERGYVETIFGRRRYLPNINSSNAADKAQAERQAVNSRIQGSASDLVKRAMCEIDKKLKEKFPLASIPIGTKKREIDHFVFPILNLHDELFYEVRKEKLNQVAEIVKTCMEFSAKLDVQLPVLLQSGSSWGTMKNFTI